MSLITVSLADTFDDWRVKTNSIGTNTGDLVVLNTTNKSSLVAAINELFASGRSDIVGDTTPELGGDLDLLGNNILNSSGTSNITVNGVITADTFTGRISLVSDVLPKLGGDLMLNTNNIRGAGGINIAGELRLSGPVLTVGVTSETLTVGEIITGTLSGATGVVIAGVSGTNTVTYTPSTGTFIAEDITGGTSGFVKAVSVVSTGSFRVGTIHSDVTAATQSPSDNSTKLATTAYVDAQSGTATLLNLTDTTIASPTNGQQLVYDSGTSKWVNTTAAAGATQGFAVAIALALG